MRAARRGVQCGAASSVRRSDTCWSVQRSCVRVFRARGGSSCYPVWWRPDCGSAARFARRRRAYARRVLPASCVRRPA
jgi:hypothetical protein